MVYENEHRFQELADRLKKVPISDPRWNNIQDVIQRCENNSYHDFANPDDIPAPKMQMIADLRKIGMEDEAQRVMNGDYDQ